MDTQAKCDKWGLNNMIKPNAVSSETNMEEKTKNILMVYLHENRLIISPWNGEDAV